MKPKAEIEAEIYALHSCALRLRQRYSAWGDDNVAAIGAQVCALQQRMDMAAVERHYTPTDPHSEHQHYLFDAVVLACEWMHDVRNEEALPSGPDGWGGLCAPKGPTPLQVMLAARTMGAAAAPDAAQAALL